ncbi:RagB/SusD family nutrient uptake outer membrane protein [Parabacteroides pacaensis]|uniref:RagB/SusD family nutrient uptake outer membrane protein n=1 Tax=Parabacteroides pacaensis TaxID=2086575 RepID=UPI000D0FD2CE|nr:RagB/SusD family nutrient uptake outer membrane protein [Parabacteroides pacaensis]
MKNKYWLILLILAVGSCDLLDTKIDTLYTQHNIDSDYSKIRDLGYAGYTHLLNGFWRMDNNIAAAMSDEAEQTASSSQVQMFNEGSWGAFNNPDDVYSSCYRGIRNVNYFLEYSQDYKNQLAHNRDTLTDNAYQYHLDVMDIGWLRAESHVLRAYYYFELIKRYGDVPLIKESLGEGKDAPPIPREPFDKITDYIVSEIEYAEDSLQIDWRSVDSERDGRFTKGAALALKARILLYAASPLHNSANDVEKWKKAAQAAYEVIRMNKYSLSADYGALFIGDNSVLDNEVIMAYRCGSTNDLEKANYPIGTPGGQSGVTPSHNLVAAYEYKGAAEPGNPYANRDPRLAYSIVTNHSVWNDRFIEIEPGGRDDYTKPNVSKTGYYLKKFLNDNLYLVEDEKRVRSWILFRYAEVLLNYAEAMNEAYGPDIDNGYSLTARQAINLVRSRLGVEMPEVIAAGQNEMRERIKHERRIELAFEEHRYWDLLRWKDAEKVLNQPLTGIRAVQEGADMLYSVVTVENRKFEAPKMYLYPIPQTEVNKSGNVVTQTPGWE